MCMSEFRFQVLTAITSDLSWIYPWNPEQFGTSDCKSKLNPSFSIGHSTNVISTVWLWNSCFDLLRRTWHLQPDVDTLTPQKHAFRPQVTAKGELQPTAVKSPTCVAFSGEAIFTGWGDGKVLITYIYRSMYTADILRLIIIIQHKAAVKSPACVAFSGGAIFTGWGDEKVLNTYIYIALCILLIYFAL